MNEIILKELIIPLIWAVILGALGGVITWRYTEWDYVGMGAVVAFVAIVVPKIARGVLYWSERVTGIDLDRNGLVGKPSKEVPAISEHQLGKLAVGALAGAPLTIREWVGKNKVFRSREEFDRVLGYLAKQRYVQWKNPGNHQAGREWTDKGLKFLKEYA